MKLNFDLTDKKLTENGVLSKETEEAVVSCLEFLKDVKTELHTQAVEEFGENIKSVKGSKISTSFSFSGAVYIVDINQLDVPFKKQAPDTKRIDDYFKNYNELPHGVTKNNDRTPKITFYERKTKDNGDED